MGEGRGVGEGGSKTGSRAFPGTGFLTPSSTPVRGCHTLVMLHAHK